ncbi:hypothetical protein, partial [Psychromonas sp. SP041]|uniref:hypothetical protein n=1 Tax=Psychromonas sp. SP041 TaxID=1365007 RepID=UPI00197E1D96
CCCSEVFIAYTPIIHHEDVMWIISMNVIGLLFFCRTAASFNKLLNKDKKQLVFAPSSLISTNYFIAC